MLQLMIAANTVCCGFSLALNAVTVSVCIVGATIIKATMFKDDLLDLCIFFMFNFLIMLVLVPPAHLIIRQSTLRYAEQKSALAR